MTPVQLFARGVIVHNVDLADPVDDGTFSIGNLEAPTVIDDLLTAQQLSELNSLISAQPESTNDYNTDIYLLVKRYVYDSMSQ